MMMMTDDDWREMMMSEKKMIITIPPSQNQVLMILQGQMHKCNKHLVGQVSLILYFPHFLILPIPSLGVIDFPICYFLLCCCSNFSILPYWNLSSPQLFVPLLPLCVLSTFLNTSTPSLTSLPLLISTPDLLFCFFYIKDNSFLYMCNIVLVVSKGL